VIIIVDNELQEIAQEDGTPTEFQLLCQWWNIVWI